MEVMISILILIVFLIVFYRSSRDDHVRDSLRSRLRIEVYVLLFLRGAYVSSERL